MTNMQYSFNHSPQGDTLVLFGSQGARVIPDSHANYDTLKAMLFNGTVDEARAYELADAAKTVADTLEKLTERVTLKGSNLLFDGVVVESKLAAHVVEMVKSHDSNWLGLVRFLENLMSNPSEKSRKGLWKFIDKNGLTITSDGCFIGYKAISADGKSIRGGQEDVMVTTDDGETAVHRGRIPNPEGAVVEMARDLVDPDRMVGCSVGLHVGTYSYALTFGGGSGRFMTVKVNPRDAVETPKEADGDKIRVCRYEVIEHNEEHVKYEGTSYSDPDQIPEDDDDEFGYDDEELGLEGPTYGSF